MTSSDIAIIGMACHYPGARDLRQFWENILTRRRQFRNFPDQRLPLSDYYDPDPAAPDKTYGNKAALIDGFKFDWTRHRIPKSTFESTDIVHWLALEVALKSLHDAGFNHKNIPNERSGVILGNTLTGEHSRAEGLRLRWPFVRRTIEAAARAKDLPQKTLSELLQTVEAYYKSVFSPVTEDTLSGGLSNTIAGRICNYLDFHGGGYNVDGACSSSLIAVTTASTALVNGDLDLALAGGVDISLDTFELIGFAKTAALTKSDMRVYDRRASGFIPGEGCGFVVLKRLKDAISDGNYIYSVIRGWGISSDGKGGLTAPSVKGQATALQRAYDRAGYSIRDIDFIEGHGTGTVVGDKTELHAISLAMGDVDNGNLRSCGITSLKSVVGHTKAASGIGGFIKTAIAVNRRVLPPIANCSEPNQLFENSVRSVYPITAGEIRLPSETLKAGVSGMGFGGINCHVTMESGDEPAEHLAPSLEERQLLASSQKTELFVLGASSIADLLERVKAVKQRAQNLCEGELVDLAAQLGLALKPNTHVRAVIIAGNPDELPECLRNLDKMLVENPPSEGNTAISPQQNVFIGNNVKKSRLGFLFPGQGSQFLNMGETIVGRHEWARRSLLDVSKWLEEVGGKDVTQAIFRPKDRSIDDYQIKKWTELLKQTEISQPSICLNSLLWIHKLGRLGIRPNVVGGHSLGELTAFYAAGAFDESALLKLASVRGKAMAAPGDESGVMASLACSKESTTDVLSQVKGYIVIANINGPKQVVISGERSSVEEAVNIAKSRGIRTHILAVSNAFHSRFVSSAAEYLRNTAPIPKTMGTTKAILISGMRGQELKAGTNLHNHFANQVLSQVDFVSQVEAMVPLCDLILEVGPGRVLSNLANTIVGDNNRMCQPIESRQGGDRDLNTFLSKYFINGGIVNWEALYEDRLVRPFVPVSERIFIENPCERPYRVSGSKTLQSVSEDKGQLESALTDAVDISPQILASYLSRRHKFIESVIKADLENLPPYHNSTTVPSSAAPDSSEVTDTVIKEEQNSLIDHNIDDTNSVSSLLFELVEKRTGFPKESLSLDLRLLDDLNLDSIKASELIAEVSMRMGVAGEFDVSRYANATLNEIADVLGELKKDYRETPAHDTTSKPEVSTPGLLFELVEKRTGFPRESLSMDLRLLDDLNLDSIKASELIAEASMALGVAGDADVSKYANATLKEIAAALDNLKINNSDAVVEIKKIDVRDDKPSWVRNFVVKPVMEEPSHPSFEGGKKYWEKERVLLLSEKWESNIASIISEKLVEQGAQVDVALFADERLKTLTGNHHSCIITILPTNPDKNGLHKHRLANIIDRLRTAALLSGSPDNKQDKTISFIQFGGGYFGEGTAAADIEQCTASALAASLHLERPDLKVRVLDFDPATEALQLAEKIIAELSTSPLYAAIGYDVKLNRRVPKSHLQEPSHYIPRNISWSSEDVVLVTGGAKGITAECSLAFAKQTNVRMALVGSSPHPHDDYESDKGGEIAQTLKRFNDSGLMAKYYQCNIVDDNEVKKLVEQVQKDMGNITCVIHGSGMNRPGNLNIVSTEEALEEVSPKVLGAVNLCNALKESPPELFIGFSSIIGLSGMIRNGWYGFSNEALNLILCRFEQDNPDTSVLSIAFSIWDDVGMGVRMGSTKYLAQMGIKSIPATEGVRRFLQLIMNDPGEKQVVVAARIAGLDTFQFESFPLPETSRFLDKIMYYHPDVEVVSRTHLSLEKDTYVKDHLWRGTYLFPTVFGLEAMVQAAAYVTGESNFDSLRIEDIRLERPIPVNPESGVEIEIHAEVLELEKKEDNRRVRVGISTEQTGFAVDHFSAVFVLNVSDEAPKEHVDLPSVPLEINPEQDLYNGKLLFQGPQFQRIDRIYSLDSKKCIFRSRLTDHQESRSVGQGDSWLLGDPFFRDSLLHSAQLPVSRDISLPVKIKSIERYQVESGLPKSLTGVAIIEDRNDHEIHATVFVVNDSGHVIEKMKGYALRILEHHEEYPAPEDIADPGKRDENIIREEIKKRAHSLGLEVPEVSAAYIPGIHELTKKERHKKELPVFHRVIGEKLKDNGGVTKDIQVKWNESGKPALEGVANDNLDISLSHDESTLLCVAGTGSQGCDIAPITKRTQQDWIALLSSAKKPLLAHLPECGDSPDQAGTRIWAASEALQKAANSPDSDLSIEMQTDDTVVFKSQTSNGDLHAITFPVKLTRDPERMVAVVARTKKNKKPDISDAIINRQKERLSFDIESYKADIIDGPQGQPVFIFQFPITFKEASNPSRTLYFSHFFAWIGKLREFSIHPIYEQLVQWFSTGKWGMVTNHAETTIHGEAVSGDVIEGRLWLDKVYGQDQSTLEFCFEWRKVRHGRDNELIASSRMSTTWVAIKDHGVVEVKPLPEFAQEFANKLLPQADQKQADSTTTTPMPLIDCGKELYAEPAGPVKSSALLREQIFETTLEDANLVGNIYFSNYYIWQGRVRDNFLYEIEPEYFRSSGEQGELRSVKCKINHMNEAMPFDRIAVRMYRSLVSERGIKFYFDFFRLGDDGKRYKLGYGEHEAVWFAPDNEGKWVPTALPPVLCNSLIPKEKQDSDSRFSVKQEENHQEYDVTIVGSGIGGLTAGALLAKQGLRVLVLEHHDKPGGFCTSFKRNVKRDNKKLSFTFDAGVHDICGLDRHIGKLLRELDIEDRIEWLRVGHEYVTPEFQLKVPHNIKDYIEELGRQFPNEKGALVSFFQEIEICYRELLKIEQYNRSHISKWMNVPFTKMLDTFFHDSRLKKILSILHCYISDDVQNINTLTMIPVFYYYLFGGYYPSGGSQAFPDALVSVIENHNGKVQLRTAVSRILIKDGHTSGVELANGEVIPSRIVISNADIRRTFLDLIGHNYLPTDFTGRIENLRPSNSAFQVFLGVDFVPDLESVTMMIKKDEMLAIMISSNVDPSLAPPGHACIALIMLSPHEQAHSWDRSDPGYTKRKKQFGDRVIALAEKALPNLREHIIYRQDASPVTFARYAWTTNGAIYGLAIDEWRPSMKSPIEGLYLTGASISARPGVEDAVYTGITVAEEIIKQNQNKECSA